MEILAGLYSVFHHLSLARGDNGFVDWRRRVLEYQTTERDEAAASWIRGHMKLSDAVQTLAQVDGQLRQIATAAYVQGFALDQHREGTPFTRDDLERLRPDLPGDDERWDDLLDRLIKPGHYPGSDRARTLTGDEVFQRAYELLDRGCVINKLTTNGFIDPFGVSTFEAEVVVERPEAIVDTYTSSIDPRNWSSTLEFSFENSYQVSTDLRSPATHRPIPSDPFVDPEPMVATQAAEDVFAGPFFEDFGLSILPGVRLPRLRNILHVEFTKVGTPTTTAIRLDYRLREALSNRLFTGTQQGALDVDSGRGSVEKVSNDLVFHGSKSLRFTPAMPFYFAFNLAALPFLYMWMTAVLLLGACAAPHE